MPLPPIEAREFSFGPKKQGSNRSPLVDITVRGNNDWQTTAFANQTHSIFDPNDPSAIDQQRYIIQCADPRMQSGKGLERLSKATTQDPNITYEEAFEPDKYDFLEAMIHSKKWGKAADHFNSQDDEEKAFICEKRALLSDIRAFSLESRDCLCSDLINAYHQKGFLERHPEEAQKLLEIAIKHQTLDNGIHRFEFFDAYFNFMSSIGKIAEVLTFILGNLDCFANMETQKSTILVKIIQTNSPIRLELIKHRQTEYERMFGIKKARTRKRPKKGRKTQQSAPERLQAQVPIAIRAGALFSYVSGYCIKYKGDYLEARKTLKRNPQAAAAMTEIDKENLQKSLDNLIPPILDEKEFAGLPENGDELHAAMEAQSATNLQRMKSGHNALFDLAAMEKHQQNMNRLLVLGLILEAKRKNTTDAFIETLKNCQINADGNIAIVFESTRTLVDHFTCEEKQSPEDILKNYHALRNALDSDTDIHVALEIQQIVTARAVQAAYKLGQYAEAAIIATNEARNQHTILRGTVFHLLKATQEAEPATMGSALRVSATALAQFEACDEEENLWLEIIVPNYRQHEHAIHSSNTNQARGLAVLKALDDSKKSPEVKTVITSIALRIQSTKNTLVQLAREMNNAGEMANADWEEFRKKNTSLDN